MSSDKSSKIMEIIDLVFSDSVPEEILKKMGISEAEYDFILKNFIPNAEPYYRVFSAEDKKVLTPEAYGYLYHLLLMRSINRDLFEKIIFFSVHLSEAINHRVNKKMVDDVLNFLMFSGYEEVSIEELIDFCIKDKLFT